MTGSTATDTRPISTTELAQRLTDPGLVIVDIRPLTAYNGWRTGGESRGGHIPGAVSFPLDWLTTVDGPEISRLLERKGLTPDREIVAYGRGRDDAAAFVGAIGAYGLVDARPYPDGFAAWAADPERPVDKLLHHHKLVHIDWLQELQAGGRPEAAPEGDYVLLHVNFGVPEEYQEAHIPGAIYLDTNTIEDPADWNRRSPEALDMAIRALGITKDTTVIVYGRDTEGHANEKWPGRRAGQIAATRALMILTYAGVDDVRLLDGGYDWWVRAGHPVESVIREPSPVADFGAVIPVRPEVIVDLDEAKQILADPDGAALVSVRSWREHIGAVSGYNYIGPAGRIKGDVWGNCGSDAYHMQHYRNIDNTMRAYPEIVANWAEAGIVPEKWVAFYCGTGWRASETWFYAFLQGWPRVAVYDGGWFEWSQDPDNNPIEVGLPDVAEPRDVYIA
jgi:molybdopterin synthase sulfurtransferase